jgi:adenosylhomocysteine nucleosidase
VNDVIHNSGFMATRGATTNIGQLAAGPGAGITNVHPMSQAARSASRSRSIGLVTIKATEARAVIDIFGLTKNRATPSGQDFYTGTVESADGPVNLIATRTLEQGQRSIIPTLENLRRHSNPTIFILVGIGGAINRNLVIGDVVVATRVVYYDLRRETPGRHPKERTHAARSDLPPPPSPTPSTRSLPTTATQHSSGRRPAHSEYCPGSSDPAMP